jgi:hypothetical protein
VAMWFTCHLENLKLWTTGHMKDQIPESQVTPVVHDNYYIL